MIKKKKQKLNKYTGWACLPDKINFPHVITSEAKQSAVVKALSDFEIATDSKCRCPRNDINIYNDINVACHHETDIKIPHVIASEAKQSHGRKAFVPLQIASVISFPRNDMKRKAVCLC